MALEQDVQIQRSGVAGMSASFAFHEQAVFSQSNASVPVFAAAVTERVAANRYRTFQALTVPEYVETWFSIPGTEPGSVHVSHCEGGLWIDALLKGGRQFRIDWQFDLLRRGKVQFTWTSAEGPRSGCGPSHVKVTLCGDFAFTRISLTHFGLAPEDLQWHQDIWDLSFSRLRSLF